jgi:phosphopantothenoylcysteine decarboxylase
MANVLLGVTGSVAAIRAPALFEMLKQAGHAVKVVATEASLYFFNPADLDGIDSKRNPAVVSLDQDEWPNRDAGRQWQRNDPVLHIELRRWAELLLVAPLDANTLAKFAGGLADNCLTCVWRAWEPARPVVLAPAMNTLMWEHRLTARHLLSIAADAGILLNESKVRLTQQDPESVVDWINKHGKPLRVVPPVSKRLACGDVGVGALAPLEEIVAAVQAALML